MKLRNSPSNQVRERKDNSMTLDDLMRMAREAGGSSVNFNGRWMFHAADLEHFAALVAANEREACARVVDMNAEATTYLMLHDILQSNANAIRARGEK